MNPKRRNIERRLPDRGGGRMIENRSLLTVLTHAVLILGTEGACIIA